MIHYKNQFIHHATPAQQVMEEGTYLGFAIGADSHHDTVEVKLGETTYLVTLGAPIILREPTRGAPVVTPVRKTMLQVTDDYEAGDAFNAYQSRVHVMGYTSCQEFAVPVPQRLAPFAHRFTPAGNSVSEVQVMVLPFIGRYMAMIEIDILTGTELFYVYGGMNIPANLLGDTEAKTDTLAIDGNPLELYSTSVDDHCVIQDVEAYDVLIINAKNNGEAGFSGDLNVRLF